MVYRMRRKDGTLDTASTLAVVERDGTVRHLASDAFAWEVLGTWKSPRNNAEYPIRLRIRFEGESFELKPLAEDQEQDGGITRLPYWEGACDVLDAQGRLLALELEILEDFGAYCFYPGNYLARVVAMILPSEGHKPTQEEIIARFEAADDWLGWAKEVLIEHLDRLPGVLQRLLLVAGREQAVRIAQRAGHRREGIAPAQPGNQAAPRRRAVMDPC